MLLDVLGALFDLLSTWYFIRLNTKAWPTGLIATLINTWLYFDQGIYADMFLSGFYCINFSYGWYSWNQPKKAVIAAPLGKLTLSQWGVLFSSSIVFFWLVQLILQSWAVSSVPSLDAARTALSVAAQWLMCHKIIFTWILWLITDILYIILYIGKSLPYHALLMLIYVAMAIGGFYLWHKKKDAAVAF